MIALLTDFGSLDPFVGTMKGVIASLAPGMPMVDLTHETPPGDIRRAALNLWQSASYFPERTVFLCVVDPGVGTARRPVLVDTGGYTFIGPDNGLFTFVMHAGSAAWTLQNSAYALPNPSMTFHGRDLFAPAAAHAALGVPGPSFGQEVTDLVRLPSPRLEMAAPDTLRGEILFADHFGNLLTSLGKFERAGEGAFRLEPWLPDPAHPDFDPIFRLDRVHLALPGGRTLRWVQTFAEAPTGECAVLVGSSGLLEIVARGESAAQRLHLPSGTTISIQR